VSIIERPRTLVESMRARIALTPDRPALVLNGLPVTYTDLDHESDRVADALTADGLTAGDRVAFLGRESERYYEVLFGCAKVGVVLVPINWRLTAGEISHVLDDSRSRLLFREKEFTAGGEAAGTEVRVLTLDGEEADAYTRWRDASHQRGDRPDPLPDDAVVQMYTSGTTGLPKGVVLAHRTFFAVRDLLAEAGLDWIDWRDGDVTLLSVPGFHIGGLWWAMQAFHAGVPAVVMPVFTPGHALRAVREQGVTTLCMVPSMLRAMLLEPGAAADDFGRIRKVVYGGSPMPAALLDRCRETLRCCDFVQIYGLTETGNTAVCLAPQDHLAGHARVGAAGRPYPGVGLKVVADDGTTAPVGAIGEVWVRSPAGMLGYWRRPEADADTLVDGWVRTGDAGCVDADGYLYLHDRIKDMIISAGENIYPAEIENALASHPSVSEAAVVGIPDERWGEAVYAFVVATPGSTPSRADLTRFLRTHVASYKLPGRYAFVDALPRNPSGKILRRELRERFWTGRDRNVN